MKNITKSILKIILTILITIILIIFVLYSRIIFQEWNPVPVWIGIFKLEFFDVNYVLIDDKKYLAKNNVLELFLEENNYKMNEKMWAWVFVEDSEWNKLTLITKKFTRKYDVYKIVE